MAQFGAKNDVLLHNDFTIPEENLVLQQNGDKNTGCLLHKPEIAAETGGQLENSQGEAWCKNPLDMITFLLLK